VNPETKEIMVKLVTSLLATKPIDPVPHIYSFLKEHQKGIPASQIQTVTTNEINEMKNLKKKIEFLKEQLNEKNEAEHTPSESESDDEEEI
jgi:hypothetical protein